MPIFTHHILGINPDYFSLPHILIRSADGKESFFSGFTGDMPKPEELEEGYEVASFATIEEVDAWLEEAKANNADWIYALWMSDIIATTPVDQKDHEQGQMSDDHQMSATTHNESESNVRYKAALEHSHNLILADISAGQADLHSSPQPSDGASEGTSQLEGCSQANTPSLSGKEWPAPQPCRDPIQPASPTQSAPSSPPYTLQGNPQGCSETLERPEQATAGNHSNSSPDSAKS